MFNQLLCYKHMKTLVKISDNLDKEFLELIEKLNLIKSIN